MTAIEKLNLSVRTYNVLKRSGIDSAEQLAAMSDEELMQVREMGKRCYDEIKEKLKEMNITPAEDSNAAFELLFDKFQKETDNAVSWLKSHSESKSIERASAIKKIYCPNGYSGSGCAEYDVACKSDGVYIRTGPRTDGYEAKKYSYSCVVNKLVERIEQTLDVPVAVAEETSVAAFDYSMLDGDTAAKLEVTASKILNAKKEYIFTVAKEVAYAHGLLSSNYSGRFGAWCESIGITRQTGNNLLQVVKLFDNSTEEEVLTLQNLSPTLLYSVSKPSAPAKLVEQVMSGDITTNAEYLKLKKELEAEQQETAEAQEAARYAESRLKSKSEMVSKLADSNAELEKRIKELESRPKDVAVQIDTTAEAKFNDTLRIIGAEHEKLLDEADKELAAMRNERNTLLDKLELLENKRPEKIIAVEFTAEELRCTYNALITSNQKPEDIIQKILAAQKLI